MALTQKSVGKDLAHRFDPDDVLQSVFRSFFEHAREGLYDIPAAGDLWPLLLVIALHKVRAYGKFHRAARRNIRREQGSSGDDTASGAVDRMESSEPQPLIRLMAEETLEQMPPQYHQIMRWRLEGYDHAEIASMAGRSKRSVERIFQECRAIFQQQLPDYPHGCSEHSS